MSPEVSLPPLSPQIEGGTVQRNFKQTQTKEQIVATFLTFTKRRLDVLVRPWRQKGALLPGGCGVYSYRHRP